MKKLHISFQRFKDKILLTTYCNGQYMSESEFIDKISKKDLNLSIKIKKTLEKIEKECNKFDDATHDEVLKFKQHDKKPNGKIRGVIFRFKMNRIKKRSQKVQKNLIFFEGVPIYILSSYGGLSKEYTYAFQGMVNNNLLELQTKLFKKIGDDKNKYELIKSVKGLEYIEDKKYQDFFTRYF